MVYKIIHTKITGIPLEREPYVRYRQASDFETSNNTRFAYFAKDVVCSNQELQIRASKITSLYVYYCAEEQYYNIIS